MILVKYGIYTDDASTLYDIKRSNPEIDAFENYCREKLEKFKKKYDQNYFFYTLGILEEPYALVLVETIAIVHPFDTFDPGIGERIVRGRIKRALGKIREPYDPIPKYVNVMV